MDPKAVERILQAMREAELAAMVAYAQLMDRLGTKTIYWYHDING